MGEIKRKLSAFLHADIVGYTPHMDRDEAATSETLDACRLVIDSIIKKHQGRIVTTRGDSVLVEFASSVDAVRSAVKIQQSILTSNAELVPNRQLWFRIGVNSGEIIVKGKDIRGADVNIAARLETLAEPGGIYISEDVYGQVRKTLRFRYEFLGKLKVKGIKDPIPAYRVLFDAGAMQTSDIGERRASPRDTPDPGASDKEGDKIRRVGQESDTPYDQILRLSEAAFADTTLRDRLPKLANDLLVLFSDKPIFLASWADRHLNELLEFTSDAAKGRVYIDKGGEFVDYVMELLGLTEMDDKIFATSYIKPKAFWAKRSATAYLNKQRRLTKKQNVTITRFFLYDKSDALNKPRNKQEAKKHHAAGVHVYTGITAQLNKDLRRDMFLIENRIAAIFELTADREEMLGMHIMVKQEDVRRMSKRMQDLLDATQKYAGTTVGGA
jgi:class 3 adenylate cyclase